MPALNGLNQVRGARGEVLLTVDGAAAGAPLLAIGRFGKGRTLALMSDDAWRWNFIAAGNRESPQNHLKLVRQMVRWLAQEPSFEQVQLRAIASARPGEKIAIKLRVLKDDFLPTSQASVQLRVIGPEGEPSLVSASADIEAGEYTGEYTPTRESTSAGSETKPRRLAGKDRTVLGGLQLRETDDGFHHGSPELAAMSQGEFFSLSDWNEKSLEKIAAKIESHAPAQITEQRQTRLWSTLWPFSILLALLSVEWWMRRNGD
jgi:hypothetical protein